MNFGPKNIDYSNTKFSKFEITEDIFDSGRTKQYEYKCSYALVIKFKDIQTDNKQFDRLTQKESFQDSDILVKSFDERPKLFKIIIQPEDDKEGTQDYAIRDFLDEKAKADSSKFQLMADIFNKDVPRAIFEKAYNGSFTINNESKLTSVEFNYRKPAVEALTISYEDGRTFTVDLNHKVTNRDVDAVVPDMTLPQLYTNVDDWLEEDYEGTLGLLKEIFGFDFQTLKGANVR